MGVSFASQEVPIETGNDGVLLSSLFGEEAVGSRFEPAEIINHTTAHEEDGQDHLVMGGLAPRNLNGLIRHIDFLIQSRQSIAAIQIALDILNRYDLSESVQEKLVSQIEDSLFYAHTDGLHDEIQQMKMEILANVNLSSAWNREFLDSISLQDLVSVLRDRRAANTSQADNANDPPRYFDIALEM